MLRLATYNIWNARANWPRRLAALVEELGALNADLVAMQEVPFEASPGAPIDRFFREQTAYPQVLYVPYPGPADRREWPEGLAFLSNLALEDLRVNWAGGQPTENSWGARAAMRWQGISLGITTVHLDFRHAESRERHIMRIVRDLIDAHPSDLDILCGDFNDDGDAPLLRFLEGRADLHGYRTAWRDLAVEWHAARGERPPVTLDFQHNPRWKAKNITAPSKRFDRIYLRTSEGVTAPRILGVGRFGDVPVNSGNVVPSDHYGLYADLGAATP
jgi:endonuclease/exonuclease/phosphatase family metal-dependent hydrolase